MDTQHYFLKEEFCEHDCIALTHISGVLVCISLKVEPGARTWLPSPGEVTTPACQVGTYIQGQRSLWCWGRL